MANDSVVCKKIFMLKLRLFALKENQHLKNQQSKEKNVNDSQFDSTLWKACFIRKN